MQAEKCILIGCDDPDRLGLLMSVFKEAGFAHFRITSVTRGVDLIKIRDAVAADIIILSFWNNQLAINTYFPGACNNEIPVLCVTRGNEIERLFWSDQQVMFTYPIEHFQIKNHLCSCINSIFLLQAKAPVTTQWHELSIKDTLSNGISHTGDAGNLSRYVMELDQKTALLSRVKNRISELHKRADSTLKNELTSIVNAIKMAQNDKNSWVDFMSDFEKNNPAFFKFLVNNYPYLTPIDLKYCCYLKMNMSYDDIRNLLGINQESVRTHTYRLKKKLSLTKNENLRNFLRSAC
jgi:DNA-binding CsgD family transcriptional regulator